MNRIPAPRRSLSAAVLGSVILHAALLCAAWPRPPVASQSKVQVIEARLLQTPGAPAAVPVSAPTPDLSVPAPEAKPEPEPVKEASEPSPRSPIHEAPAVAAPEPPPPTAVPAPARTQPERLAPVEPAAAVAESPGLPEPVQPEVGVVVSAGAAAAYLPVSELDPPPRPLTEIHLAYPPDAGTRAGNVVLDLLIGASGAVENVKVIEATPPGLFEASAITAFVGARFSPGMRAGVPTAARMQVAVQYSATGMAVSGANAPLQAPLSR